MTTAVARPTARQRAHAAMVEDIKRIAREQLTTEGAGSLSLRAVARELGVVSSAVYRYVPSRDELLTMLIEDAYNDSGAAVEAAVAAVAPDDYRGRFLAVARAIRTWALEHPSEYALLYGSPVPGYHAPAERTVGPATRTTMALIQILMDGVRAGRLGSDGSYVPAAVRRDFAELRRGLSAKVPDDLLMRGFVAWMQIFGAVSFEIFGQLNNVVTDRGALFEAQMSRIVELIDLG
jgi:AcrR family transcriptional regulator